MKAQEFFSASNIKNRFLISCEIDKSIKEQYLDFFLIVLDKLDSPVFIVDKDIRLWYFNRAYWENFGPDWVSCHPNGKITAEHVEKLVGYPLAEIYEVAAAPMRKVIKTGQPILHKTFSGTEKYISDIHPLCYGKEVVGALVVSRDMATIAELSGQLDYYRTLSVGLRNEIYSKDKLPPPFQSIIGSSPLFAKALRTAAQVAPTQASVCIFGESGTGKEVVAKAIHLSSHFVEGPMIKVNCAAIPETLIESELFGYEKGAFTGANSNGKPGKFELANGGTLFLDEIGEMPLGTQVKLLRALQEREITRVGGVRAIPLNFRLLTATNQNLKEMVKNGTFREDLYYRINVINLDIPPLRERLQDIPLLCDYFLNEMSNIYSKTPKLLTETIDQMQAYRWPGNVRELRNCIERMVVMCTDGVLSPDLLPEQFSQTAAIEAGYSPDQGLLHQILDQNEREAICSALEQANGNRSKAIEILGISRRSFYNKLEKYHLK